MDSFLELEESIAGKPGGQMGHSQQQHTTLSLGDISGSGLRSLRRHVGGIPAQRLLRTGDGRRRRREQVL